MFHVKEHHSLDQKNLKDHASIESEAYSISHKDPNMEYLGHKPFKGSFSPQRGAEPPQAGLLPIPKPLFEPRGVRNRWWLQLLWQESLAG